LIPWLLASPTKALCDTVALDASIRSKNGLAPPITTQSQPKSSLTKAATIEMSQM
jgi:hypothetical protein